jgi:SAM-dependent methyltransferase
VPSCPTCGSTSRDRQIAHLLSMALFGNPRTIPSMPTSQHIRGVGLSDSNRLATRLCQKFNYINTFFDRAPELDITEVPDDLCSTYDFLISSDVFEHVAPPIARAFVGARRLLKPGGVFLLTTPYSMGVSTREHFPELHEYSIIEDQNQKILVNRTSDGREQVYRDLVFHGGDGATLEMRIFSLSDIQQLLHEAGFTYVKIWEEQHLPHGVYQVEPWARPISAIAA